MRLLLVSLFPLIVGFSFQAQALDLEVHVHNPCRQSEIQCFQMDVYLNGNLQESWITSPGNPNNRDGFQGENTPEFKQGQFTSRHGADYESHKRGDPMPYAMHINGTGFAVHGSGLAVDGTKQSHGCMRLKKPNAQKLNDWLGQALDSGGLAQITVEDTEHTYPDEGVRHTKKKVVKTKKPKVTEAPVVIEDAPLRKKRKTLGDVLDDIFKPKKKKKVKPAIVDTTGGLY